MRTGQWEDFVQFDAAGHMIHPGLNATMSQLDSTISNEANAPVNPADDEPNFTPVGVGSSTNGFVDFSGDRDIYSVNLVQGQTYVFSLQGTGDHPLNDTFLELFNPSLSRIALDDDGGVALNSIITYTATQTGTFHLRTSSFANPGDPGLGSYTLDVQQMGVDSVGNTNATAGSLDIGHYVVGFRESGSDVDRYAVTLQAGQFYTFQVAGGADYATDYQHVPTGELDTFLILRDANGTALASNDDNNFPSDISSGVGFYADVTGTYYLDVNAYPGQTGGYVLSSSAPVDPTTLDPLDAIRWVNANNVPAVTVDGVPTAYVYFAPASDGGFGEMERTDDYPPGTPITTYGWQQYQIDGVMSALQNAYTQITGIHYVQTTDINRATFRLVTTINDDYGARFHPQDPSDGSLQGVGVFNLASGGFGTDPGSLAPGGFSYAVVLHEFGHAHGLAHPHDNGGGSDVMLGVTGADSLGVFDLNQGVYTVMSYNDGWPTDPDGTRTYSSATRGSGWTETLSPFDIAALQERYGEHANNTGDTVYTIADNQADASYQAIWDTKGTDTIAYTGNRDAQIDLLAATLDYSPTGGGVVSFAHGVFGGYTIAHNVVIENATGGAGNDVLLGNSADNVLTGNAGNDTLMGREGNDFLIGGAGNDSLTGGVGVDTASFAGSAAGLTVNLVNGTATGEGNDTLSTVENVIGSAFKDKIVGDVNVNTIKGGDGIDLVTLGGGNDVFVAEFGTTKSVTKTGTWSWDVITDFDQNGDDLIDLTGLGLHWDGTSANKDAGDLTYKVYASLNGAENALGIDIDGQSGATGVTGPVTVVYGNDSRGGSPDAGTANRIAAERGTRMRAVILVLVLAIVAIIAAIATGFVNINQIRGAKAPEITATNNGIVAKGGQAPAFDVETGSVKVGTQETQVKVPALQVVRPGNQAAAPANNAQTNNSM